MIMSVMNVPRAMEPLAKEAIVIMSVEETSYPAIEITVFSWMMDRLRRAIVVGVLSKKTRKRKMMNEIVTFRVFSFIFYPIEKYALGGCRGRDELEDVVQHDYEHHQE